MKKIVILLLLSLPDGGVKGDVYCDFKTNFHSVGLSGELNLLGLGGKKKPLSLYAGTGIACLFAEGNSYTISVSNTIKPFSWQIIETRSTTSIPD